MTLRLEEGRPWESGLHAGPGRAGPGAFRIPADRRPELPISRPGRLQTVRSELNLQRGLGPGRVGGPPQHTGVFGSVPNRCGAGLGHEGTEPPAKAQGLPRR